MFSQSKFRTNCLP